MMRLAVLRGGRVAVRSSLRAASMRLGVGQASSQLRWPQHHHRFQGRNSHAPPRWTACSSSTSDESSQSRSSSSGSVSTTMWVDKAQEPMQDHDVNGHGNGNGNGVSTAVISDKASSSSRNGNGSHSNGHNGTEATQLLKPSQLGPLDDDKSDKGDLGRITTLAFPLMVQNLFGYLLSVVCTVSIGRIGPPELAASSLANSVYVVTGLSLVMGLSSAMETLCGQAYGAGNYKVLGEVLQRALLVCWVACLPVAFLWMKSAGVMVAAGQDPTIAAMAGRYLALCIPCLFFGITNDCLKKYLQAQSIVAPSMYATAAATVAAPAFFWVFVHKLQWGLDGAALAFCLCQFTTMLGIGGYVIRHTIKNKGSPTATWGGFSRAAAFSNWGQYLRYGLPAMVMVSLDWWVYECSVLMTGWLPHAQLALSTGGICMMINSWSYMVPMGLGSAVNTCVSNALGSGNGGRAKRIAAAGVGLTVAVEAAMATGLITQGHHIVHLITQDPSVAALATGTLPVLGVLIFFDGMNAVLSGVLRGSGEQATGAAISTGYLALALPLCYTLTFLYPNVLTSLPLIGPLTEPVTRVWLGVALGSFTQSLVQAAVIWRWDWQAKAKRAIKTITS